MFMKNIFFSVDHQARAEKRNCDHLERKSGHFAQGKQGELVICRLSKIHQMMLIVPMRLSSGLPSKITQKQIADKCSPEV
jgi:hypothetical protein